MSFMLVYTNFPIIPFRQVYLCMHLMFSG
ncbi:hypothetical protein F383_28636 [Gossypium arboreum]|uniref:Uncharacterized protein n=1 Tax=Gossypium arboreum TaxID=29729 RepID=A0A0B0MFL5_GOSAR|nr:hypothetical protein F383_38469 [Gossypium arboreum]KHG23655.1 hypothetical protein F383_28636 [Gossypium arboreum]